ncbi:MAG: PhzF family phenazine biosynthesis protein [Acidobacteriia bacterium]|nr:PhzF family phenazine biosynthesis protein [Terriglobia bacterium]
MTDPTTFYRHTNFYIVDVFSDQPLTGNPLAVVPDAGDLDVPTMQRFAREFNQSETTFLMSPTKKDADWRLRCFTPTGAEVTGAGHNALGAWWWLAEAGRLKLSDSGGSFSQEIGDKVLPVEVIARSGRLEAIGMIQTPPVFGKQMSDLRELASALGLEPNDLDTEKLPAQVVSTGAAHLLVPARSRSAVERAKPDAERLAAVLRSVAGQGCYLFCLDPIDPSSTAHARFFNPTVGISEDPATGSAAGPLACYLIERKIVPDGSTITVEQGHSLGRPSLIKVSVQGNQVNLTGRGVVVAQGVIRY